MHDQDRTFQRWTAKRKTQVVVEILKGKLTIAEVSRQYDLTPAEVENWIDQAQANIENGFRSKPKDVEQLYEAQLKDAHAALGEALLENKALKKLQRSAESAENS